MKAIYVDLWENGKWARKGEFEYSRHGRTEAHRFAIEITGVPALYQRHTRATKYGFCHYWKGFDNDRNTKNVRFYCKTHE